MNNFEKIKSANIDELTTWIDQNDNGYDDTPWTNWFSETYCSECEVIGDDGRFYGWCELNDGCKFFPDSDDIPDNKEIIKFWLESEVKDEEIEC